MIAEMVQASAFLQGAAQLQWGRDQMIAEIRRPRSGRRWGVRLQWGRDQMIAEMWDAVRQQYMRIAASMGPRSNDRGNGGTIAGLRGGAAASMGPRSNDRGNRRQAVERDESELGFNGAAIK